MMKNQNQIIKENKIILINKTRVEVTQDKKLLKNQIQNKKINGQTDLIRKIVNKLNKALQKTHTLVKIQKIKIR